MFRGTVRRKPSLLCFSTSLFSKLHLIGIVRNSTIISNPLVALSIFVQLPEFL